MIKKLSFCVIFLFLTIANIANGKWHVTPDDQKNNNTSNVMKYGVLGDPACDAPCSWQESLVEKALHFIGTRYRSGGKGPSAFDCSGFTSYIYQTQADVFIGASSKDQYARNPRIKRSDLQSGDLVFFTSPGSGHSVGHVGIVVDVDTASQHFTFIHSSSKYGVRINKSTEENYARRYVGACRITL